MENNILMIFEDLKKTMTYFQSDGEISANHPIIQDMLRFINSLELNVVVIHFKGKDTSKFAIEKDGEYVRTPLLFLYTKHISELVKNEINLENSNWDDSYRNTKLIVNKWNTLLSYYGFPNECRSDDTKVLINSVERFYRNLMYRKLKAEILEICKKLCDDYTPRFLFVDSTPSYTILFSNKDDLMNFISFRKNDFEDKALKMFSEVNIFSHYKIESINFNYDHLDNPNLNIYGLSRED